MSRATQFNNLRDMIAFVEDANLQHDFFCLYAPSIVIDWQGLPAESASRAEAIVAALEGQREKSATTQAEYDKVFSELRTVALVNAESENWAHLHALMETKPAFLAFYNAYFGTGFSPKNANVAVFINLVSRGVVDAADKAVVRQSGEIWKEILARASADILQAQISPATQFEPSALTVGERNENLKDFEDALRLRLLGAFGKKDFYVAVHPILTRTFSHYVVTTSPLPHSVVAVNLEKTDTVTKDDDHAQTFEIVVDEMHNRLHSSKTMLIGPVPLAQCFIEKMLRSQPVKRQKLNYEKALQVFKDKSALKGFALPEPAVAQGGKIWIDSLMVRLRDELLPIEFHGNEFSDVYHEIEQQIDVGRFPYASWCVVGAVLKVRLPGTTGAGGAPAFQKFAPGGKTYTVKIGEGSFSIPGAGRSFDRLHLDVLERLQDDWGMKGLNRSQKRLGVRQASAQGEFAL